MRLKKGWYCAHKINCPRIVGDINVLISILSLINYTPLSSTINYRCAFLFKYHMLPVDIHVANTFLEYGVLQII